MKAILTDIEGTTTSIDFVTHTLFPYARAKMRDFLKENQTVPEVALSIREIKKTQKILSEDLEQILSILFQWMDEDKKILPLKILQGLIWKEGYEKGYLKGHVYLDAYEILKKWKEQGIELYIFSSGSVLAQKLLFSHTDYGDLRSLFKGYFDTTIGNKKEKKSYQLIAEQINYPVDQILFLSDVKEELDAAGSAGLNTVLVSRHSILVHATYQTVQNFNQITL